MPLVTLEEYAQQHDLDVNYLYLLVAAGRIPHKRQLGRVYVDAQVLEKLQEEDDFWRRQFPSK